MSRNVCDTMWCKGARAPGSVSVKGRTVTAKALSFSDRVQRGAFRKSIRKDGPEARDRIWMLDGADLDKRLGKPSKVWEKRDGLYFRTRLPHTTRAEDLLEHYKRGEMTRHLAGYVPKEEGDGVITEADLLFVSTHPVEGGGQKGCSCGGGCSCGSTKTADAVARRLSRKIDRLSIH